MLLRLFLSQLIEMDPWISKVITGGGSLTHRDGAFLMNDRKNEVWVEIKRGVLHPRGMLVRKAPTWSTAWRKMVEEFQL